MTHSSKITEAGEMHSITLNGITTYVISTKKGFFRGGKIYFVDKVFRVLAGEVEFIHCSTFPPDKGVGFDKIEDICETIIPESGEKIISAGIPHIFRAVTDCVFSESFPENTKSGEYERYRAMKLEIQMF